MSRRPTDPVANLAIGQIIEVDGTHIVAELHSDITELTRVFGGTVYPIGQFGSILKIHFGRRIIFAYVSRLRMKSDFDREKGVSNVSDPSARVIEADLFGEGEWVKAEDSWTLAFERGVSTFPLPLQAVYLTPRDELAQIYGDRGETAIRIGEHVGTGGAPCYLDVNELFGKHSAILGSTGAGKSSAVAAVLHAVLEHSREHDSKPRVIILDPHNEYGKAFPGHRRLSTDEGSLSLPYWMLDLEETVALIIGKTEFAATSQTNVLRNALLEARRESATTLGLRAEEITVDSPVPYEIGDPTGLDIYGNKDGSRYEMGLVGHINKQRPPGQNKEHHSEFNKIVRKIQSLLADARLSFMMSSWRRHQNDPLPTVLYQLLGDGAPVTVVDLSGVPNEVAGAASSLLARTLFAAKLWQFAEERKRNPVLLVCEEAHRYVPDRGEAQYAAAREAIQRLAKEGRKYGIGILLVSQRPSEVDATVLSQCNTWIVLRITNEADREKVKSILPDSLAGLTKILSGLRQREAVVVGQATALPSRVLIRRLDEEQLPQSQDISFCDGWKHGYPDADHLNRIAARWRRQDRRDQSQNIASEATDDPPF